MPATMAVLTAAPRAFAQSPQPPQQCSLYFEWKLEGGVVEDAPESIIFAQNDPPEGPRMDWNTTWTYSKWTLRVLGASNIGACLEEADLAVYASPFASENWVVTPGCVPVGGGILTLPFSDDYAFECTEKFSVTSGDSTSSTVSADMAFSAQLLPPGVTFQDFSRAVFLPFRD